MDEVSLDDNSNRITSMVTLIFTISSGIIIISGSSIGNNTSITIFTEVISSGVYCYQYQLYYHHN